jgi:hypothetical protein
MAVLGVAEVDCDRAADMHHQPAVWCLAVYWGDKVHHGTVAQGFAPCVMVELATGPCSHFPTAALWIIHNERSGLQDHDFTAHG